MAANTSINAITTAALLEAERIVKDPNTRRFHSVYELFEELESDEDKSSQ